MSVCLEGLGKSHERQWVTRTERSYELAIQEIKVRNREL